MTDQEIYDALYDVIDPELGFNIVDLGLVYRVHAREDGVAEVDFTLTYPGCPLGDVISKDIVDRVGEQTDARMVTATLVWSPPWNEGRMSENARLIMGYPI
ncbi:MAG: metal-sulfur cluster assembly factor [Spirochaetales bacterium]|nr:metal-sulfur cluster assembly factor [Spirochaetales bacterium]